MNILQRHNAPKYLLLLIWLYPVHLGGIILSTSQQANTMYLLLWVPKTLHLQLPCLLEPVVVKSLLQEQYLGDGNCLPILTNGEHDLI